MTFAAVPVRQDEPTAITCAGAEKLRKPSVLILSTTFPPRGGSSVQRVYYQARMLSELGHTVRVVTAQHHDDGLTDDGASFQGFPERHIVRTPVYSSFILKLRAKISRIMPPLALYPDRYAAWRKKAGRAAAGIVECSEIDVVLVSRGSPSALQLAWELKQKYDHLKVAVDIRDLWVDNPVNFYSRKAGPYATTARDREMELKWMAAADVVFTVSPHHLRVMSERLPDFPRDCIRVIHNGYDEELFTATCGSQNTDNVLTLRYLGFVVPTQRIDTLFKAIAQLQNLTPDLPSRLRCEFYGGSAALVRQMADQHSVGNIVSAHPYVSHETAVSLMKAADVLLLLWTADPGCMCGKFYEYMRANQYILALDQGNIDARSVLERSGRGDWIDGSDVHEVASRLKHLLEYHQRGKPLLDIERLPDISMFSRRSQAELLSSSLTQITSHSHSTTDQQPSGGHS